MKALRGDYREACRQELARLLQHGDRMDLVRAALWVAAEDYPDLDIGGYREKLRRIADEGARRAQPVSNPFARLDVLRSLLVDELGFRGNSENYDDRRNSYLNEVIDRRRGIPLTLSIVFLQVARAAGFEARGIGLPGHFVCRVTFEGRSILVDPFHDVRFITEEDCRQLVTRSTGRPSLFRREQLNGVDEPAMIARLLLNLKHVFLSQGDYARALSAVERLLLVRPDDRAEIRDRGLLKGHLGKPGAAIADLETYLSLEPEAPDAESVRGRLIWLRRRLSQIN